MTMENLWQLQLLELAKQEKEKGLNRQALKALTVEKKEILSREAKLDEEKTKLRAVEKSAKQGNQQLEALEEQKKELNRRLYSGEVSNPKELSHLEEQISNLEGQINSSIDNCLQMEEKEEEMKNSISLASSQLVADKKDYNHRARNAKQAWDAGRAQLAELEGQIEVMAAQVEPGLLTQYRRLQRQLGVVAAVADTEKGFCGGCRIQLPSHLYQRIRQGNLVTCENCGRILISQT